MSYLLAILNMLLFNVKGLRLEFSAGRRSKSRKSARLARSGWVNRSNPVACGIAEKVGQGATQQPSIDMALSDLTTAGAWPSATCTTCPRGRPCTARTRASATRVRRAARCCTPRRLACVPATAPPVLRWACATASDRLATKGAPRCTHFCTMANTDDRARRANAHWSR